VHYDSCPLGHSKIESTVRIIAKLNHKGVEAPDRCEPRPASRRRLAGPARSLGTVWGGGRDGFGVHLAGPQRPIDIRAATPEMFPWRYPRPYWRGFELM
jgi:hypothetical protein